MCPYSMFHRLFDDWKRVVTASRLHRNLSSLATEEFYKQLNAFVDTGAISEPSFLL
jgi:hypothetical protein